MRRFTILLTAFLALTASALTPQALKDLLGKPGNIQGEFVQERFLKNLPRPVQSGGEFVLVPGKLLLWQMKTPFALNLRVREDGVAQQDERGQWQVQGNSARQVALFMALLAGDMAALDKQFQQNLSGDAQQWQLQLTPKDALMRQIFVKITLQGNDFVREVVLEETQGDRTVLRFARLRGDAPLPDSAQQAMQP